ncbi:MAG: prolipoprotein diacylglyceryl transferase [Cyclobacteriaceae bacterium]
MSWIEKLKERWGVHSAGQVILILVTFACTGFSVLYLKEPLFNLAGITQETSPWIRIPFYIVTVLPAYQILLLAYGFIFGQFRFFWNFEKKMFSRFRFKKATSRTGVE